MGAGATGMAFTDALVAGLLGQNGVPESSVDSGEIDREGLARADAVVQEFLRGDVDVPGAPYTFGVVNTAQARGDFDRTGRHTDEGNSRDDQRQAADEPGQSARSHVWRL